MQDRAGFMLLEAIASLLLFSLILSLFFLKKPIASSFSSLYPLKPLGNQTVILKSGNIELKANLITSAQAEQRYIYFEDVE